MSTNRRRVRTGARLFALFALTAAAALSLPASPLLAAPAESVSQEKLMAPAATPLSTHALGNPDAPVTIVEYASLTCSHCADFHNEIFPKLKAKYIDTGKVYFIFREMPFDPVATAGFMLARCMPEDKYFPTVGALFETQRSWAFGNDPAAGLRTVAKQAGMSDAAFEKCLTDNELAAKVQASSSYASKELEVRGTPTFFVNGKRVNGAIGMEAWDKELEPLLAAAGKTDTPAEKTKTE
ncbi:MAG: DsbA family protein [Xanthobacter sp.]